MTAPITAASGVSEAEAGTAVETFDFDAEFQTKIAALVLRDDEFLRRTSHLLNPDFFENVGEAALVNLALSHFNKYGSAPDAVSLVNSIRDSAANRSIRKDVLPLVVSARKEVLVADLSNRAYIEDKVVQFARHQATAKAILSSVDFLNSGKFDEIEVAIQAAMSIGINEDGSAYDYFAKASERTVLRMEKLSGKKPPQGITTGILKLDDLLYHRGWGRKELATILGGPKSGKCVVRDTMIFTDKGLSEIGQFVADDLGDDQFAPHVMPILGMNGIELTSHVYNSGMTKTIRATTKHGFDIEGTHHHPMLVLSTSGQHEWKNLEDIKLGDFIVAQRGEQIYGSDTCLKYAVLAAERRKDCSKRPDVMTDVTLPVAMTADLAEWLGMFVAEGYCGDKGAITFTQKDEAILNRFVVLTNDLFGLECGIAKQDSKTPFARVQNVCLQEYLEALGVVWANSASKEIPKSVLCSPKEMLLTFVSAVLGLEGHVKSHAGNKVTYELTMASERLVRQLQMLLLNEGIVATRSSKKSCATNGTKIMRDYYRLVVSGARNIVKLKTIGLYEPRKNLELAKATLEDTTARDWLPHQRELIGAVMAEFRLCGKPLKSTLSPTLNRALRQARSGVDQEVRHLTFALAEKLLTSIREHNVTGEACSRLQELVESNYFYSEVSALEFSEAVTVDVTVPDTHSFFANGLVSHNTTALINFAKSASLAGHNVLYATLEVGAGIISDRLDASIAGVLMRELDGKAHSIAATVTALEAKAGKLVLHEYGSGTLSPNMLRKLIQRYKSPGRNSDGSLRPPIKFDLVVVDYADIMAPNFRYNDTIENSKSIYVDLRAIAFEENVAMLTATQTNREGHKSTVAKAEHVADDFNKVRTVDLMISINKTEEEAARNEARLFFTASRNQESGFTVVIKQNIAMMRFIESVLRVE